jgi:hypothetical protein|tara:strand:+ start:508 stop:801 length:294 start_codon:yes stop_codon:yes gene_type:complete
MNDWIKSYIKAKKKRAYHLVDNKINWYKGQGGCLKLKVKDAWGGPMKFKTSIRGKHFVLKSYDRPTSSTNGGIWAHLTKRQALILARELLDYAGDYQ